MTTKKIILLCIFIPIIAIIIFAILFFSFFTIMEYRPNQLEKISIVNLNTENQKDFINLNTPIKITTWNLGYCGLDFKNDFFYDGGKAVLARSKEAVLENLESVKSKLSLLNSDFNILQEIDIKSKRSFYIPEKELLQEFFNKEASCFATNYNAVTVPFPFFNTLGKVHSGLFTLSKYAIQNAERHQLPGSFSWPLKTVNLKRCLLVTEFKTEISNKKLYLINIHLSAYDTDGSMRKQEAEYLKEFAQKLYQDGHWVIIGGDWNSLFPQVKKDHFKPYTTSEDLLYWIQYLDEKFIGYDWSWVFDKSKPTVRLLEKPYIAGENYTNIIDGFYVSPNVETLYVETLTTDFKPSDHQPVTAKFILKN